MHSERNYLPLRFFALACVVLALLLGMPAHAAETLVNGKKLPTGHAYFVEFHARRGPHKFGHTFIVYGRLDSHDKIIDAKIIGHSTNDHRYNFLLPTKSSLHREKHDIPELSDVIYRVYLNDPEFRQLDSKVRQVGMSQHLWHLIFFNCNDFAGEIAESVGLRRPPSSIVLPTVYVAWLRVLNKASP